VRLIPQTLSATALKERHPGELVNLETDVIAKYLRRQLSFLQDANGGRKASWNDLKEAGLL
jgi:riboflavin synthase